MTYSQSMKFKKIIETDKKNSIKEKYYVHKKQRNIKQGEYQRYLRGKLIITGQFSNNKKSGVWTYFDSDNTIDLKYDYDNDSVVFYSNFDQDTSDLDRPLIYLGSEVEARTIVSRNLSYPELAQENGKQGTVLVDIYFGKDGEIYDYKILKSVYPPLDKEAIRVVKLIPNKWLPAVKNGKRIDYKITFPINFVLME